MELTMFTATPHSDSNGKCPIEKDPKAWPTVDNIIQEVQRIILLAQAGDTVYIHYSGHGTKDRDTQQLALALYDEKSDVGLLSGVQLAGLLDDMVKAGLFVTLVLDCCFSGSVKRHDIEYDVVVRGFDYDPIVHPAFPASSELTKFPGGQDGAEVLRNARIVPHWLVNPESYTILCACTPYEESRELRFSDGVKRGALSYYLHRAVLYLSKAGNEITHQSLYQSISARFHAEWPRQNPMRYGNKNFSIFGSRLQPPDWSFTSIFWRNQDERKLCLQAGQAHGVQVGDEYGIYPMESTEYFSSTTEPKITVKVTHVGSLTADLTAADPSQTHSLIQAKSGWKARPRTQISIQSTAVLLRIDDLDSKEWAKASQGRQFFTFNSTESTEQPSAFTVIINKFRELEIVDQLGRCIPTLPTVPYHKDGSMNLMIDVLEHISSYKFIEALENRLPNPSFAGQFKVRIANSAGETADTSGMLVVKHQKTLTFRVENAGEKPAYLHLYDLGPEWQIEALITQDGGPDFLVIPAKSDRSPGFLEGEVEMTIPDSFLDRGQYQCEDVLKFVITSESTSLTAFERRRISTTAQNPVANFRGARNELSDLLSQHAIPCRGGGDNRVEDWIVMNFVVRTTCDEKTEQ